MTHTLTIVPHTHWDREWYQPFQEYRIRLVQLTDRLLDLLAQDPEYLHFTFDGQTIILEDYLEIHPEQEETLRRYVREGRLLIGPWHILPDEFLVGPEATIRNLMLGDRISRRFGFKMDVGYIPDPFGHISQLPQIMRGFGLDAVVFWRGVGEAHNEFRWAAPDGSEVLVIHLRDGYGNAAHLPDEEEGGAKAVTTLYDTNKIYTGPYKNNAPDLIAGFYPGWRHSWESVMGQVTEKVFIDNEKAWSADHCIDPRFVPGVFFSSRKVEDDAFSITDLAPTALSLFGIKPPEYMDGKTIKFK